MQDVTYPDLTPSPARSTTPALRVVLSVELVLYVALALLVAVFYLAQLGAVPMTVAELNAALPAWRLVAPATGETALVSESPLLFFLHTISFTILGGSEFAARILTALAGIALVFAPLLFRGLLGPSRSFALCIFLAFSPVVLLTARFASPVIWAMLFAVLALWSGWRFQATGRRVFGLYTVVFLALMVLLSGPVGPLAALILGIAALLATLTAPTPDPDDLDPDAESPPGLHWPLWPGLAYGGFIVVLVATGFMLYPQGLSHIGATLGAALRGFTEAGQLAAAPLLNSTFYEPFLWLFALIGLVSAIQRGPSLVDRFALGWLVAALAFALLYPGAVPAHSLLLTLPLAILASRAATGLFREDKRGIWVHPGWVRPVLATITVALLAIFTTALQSISRSIINQPATDSLTTIVQLNPIGSILILMVVMLFIAGFFLAGSLWDSRTAVQGLGLGVLVFGVVTSLAAGWNAAVPRAADPSELWHVTATTDNTNLFRATVQDIAERETRGMPSLSVTVVGSSAQDGLLAWLLRDYTDVRWVTDFSEARGAQVVVAPAQPVDSLDPDLGGSYVGQNFVLERGWSTNGLRLLDMPAWWTQRRVREDAYPINTVTLWLRQDVYQGVDPVE